MKKYAVVIGVSRYADPEITDLNFAAGDAEEIGLILREACRFHDVRVLASGGEREPDHTNVVDALCSLAPLLTTEDMFLFYFAGHGIVTETGAHLLTANSRIRMPELASVSWETLSKCLSHIECVDRVMILDACRNDPRKGMGEQDNLLTTSFSRDILAVADTVVQGMTPATCVLFSCKLGERAYEWPDKKHGAFTHYLLEGLRGAAVDDHGRVTVDSLGRYVEEQVPRWAMRVQTPRPQTPWGERRGSWREILLAEGIAAFSKDKAQPGPELRAAIKNASQSDWYYVHPEVKREWIRRTGGMTAIAVQEGLQSSGISPTMIMQRGFVFGLVYANGRPMLLTSYEALFAAGGIDLLSNFLKEEKNLKSDSRVLRLLIDGEKEKARYELSKVMVEEGHSTMHVLILSKGFHDREEAEQCLRKTEDEAEYVWQWRECAKAWKKLFDDDGEAKRCLERAESKADSSIEWEWCAEAWKESFDNDVEALRSLKCSERKVGGRDAWPGCVVDWRHNAEGWMKLFNDDNEAKRCLKRAESKADSSRDWGECAKAWKELFDDDVATKRCLKRAESKADSSYEWNRCAEAWKGLLGDDNKTKSCLERAESKVERSSDWCECAKAWKRFFDDDDEAVRCLKRAESMAESKAESCDDWCECAKAWKKLFDDDHEARHCMKQAESLATSTIWWKCCAEAWNGLDDDNEVIRCLKRWESKVDGPVDLTWLIKDWKELLHDDGEARHCLKRGESKMKNSGDLVYLATSWRELFNDDSEAKRCIEQAESKAHDDFFDWRCCVEGWKITMSDDAEARRCLKRAEAIAKSNYDWENCAEAWREILHDDSEADRCMREAKSIERPE